MQYDKRTKQLSEFQTGQTVRIQLNGYRDEWKAAIVMKKVGIQSYLVRTPNGQFYRRNRKHLRCTAEAIDMMPQNYEDGEDEFAVPGTAEQSTDETRSNGESEANTAAPSDVDQNELPRPV